MHLQRRWLLAMLVCCCSQFAKGEARLAIIIDDIGYNQILSERAVRLPGDFTLSILPFTPHGIESAQLAHQLGKELMLHAPMSNIKNIPLGLGGLYSNMSKDALVATFRQDLNNLPFIKGVNNHMGSQLTQEAEPMQWVMEEVRARGLYFVDSRTSAQTKAFDIAQAYRIPSLKRDVFLDDIEDREAIELQLNRALKFAHLRGSAVAIGHPYAITLSVLENIQPLLKQQNIKLVFASELLDAENVSQLGPLETDSTLTYCPVTQVTLWVGPSFYIQDLVNGILRDILVIN